MGRNDSRHDDVGQGIPLSTAHFLELLKELRSQYLAHQRLVMRSKGRQGVESDVFEVLCIFVIPLVAAAKGKIRVMDFAQVYLAILLQLVEFGITTCSAWDKH